jgi:hypothetical protein
MAKDFYPGFSITEEVRTTMSHIKVDNEEALRSHFSDTGGTGEPLQKVPFQMYVERTAVGPPAKWTLKIREETNTAWEPVYEFTDEVGEFNRVYIKDQQIRSAHINDTDTKPSLVTGVAIAPATCTIKTKFTGVSLPQSRMEDNLINFANQAWTDIYTTQIYVPTGASKLFIRVGLRLANMRFFIETEESNTVSDLSGTLEWSSEAEITITAPITENAWNELIIQGQGQGTGPDYGQAAGVVSRWEES